MPYPIKYHPLVAADDLPGIPENMKSKIKKKIEDKLIVDPILAGKPLRRSLKNHRKMRMGDYRIIYRIEKNTVIVLKIGHRKDVYSEVMSRL